jgi:hypothetical protein
MRKLKLAAVEAARTTRGCSLLIFLTDRCPVGCGHCSVDSRRDSPSISDYGLFADLVGAICADPDLQVVGISGGEPFIERRGLTLAVEALAGAGKDIVAYTSGVWARRGEPPGWIRAVLASASCIFLSTDAFHADAIGAARFVSAARAVAAAGTPLVVQVIDQPEQVADAKRLLNTAFGDDWPSRAELSLTRPLPYGRATGLFQLPELRPAQSLGRCASLRAPVVRYDGRVIACCNEKVIMGHGPARLRNTCRSGAELAEVLAALKRDPLLRVLSDAGTSAVTAHPGYADLTSGAYRGICDFCWRAQERTQVPLGTGTDVLIEAMSITLAPGGAAASREEA